MNGFKIRIPGTIISEIGCAYQPETYKGLQLTGKILLVTDRTLKKLGIAGKVQTALESAGANVLVYDKVDPEPKAVNVQDIITSMGGSSVDHIIGLGGGSPMDVAKLAALLIPCPQSMESVYGVGNAKGVRLPLTLIPTTAGTGSEGTPVSVVTDDHGEKAPVVSPQLICDTIILDAQLTLGLPPAITAVTGVDAMVHAIEAYTSGVRKNPVSDHLAQKALELLYGNIRTAVAQGQNIEARGNMLIGSMMAGLAFANASVGAVHALAYPLGTQFYLSHGESNALVLAPVMRYNLPEAVTLYAQLGRKIIPGCMEVGDREAAIQLIDELNRLVPELGLKHRLSECGIGEKQLDALVEGTEKQDRLLSYNIRKIKSGDIKSIFRSIL